LDLAQFHAVGFKGKRPALGLFQIRDFRRALAVASACAAVE